LNVLLYYYILIFYRIITVLEGEIHSQAVRESLGARDRYLKLKDNEEIEAHEKAGLIIHLEKTAEMLTQINIKSDLLFVMYEQ
jgi:hypothetical protein